MKKIKNIKVVLSLLIAAMAILGLDSCKKDNEGGTGAPVITGIHTVSKTDTIYNVEHRITLDSSNFYDDIKVVSFDSVTTKGSLNNMYVIRGQNLQTTTEVLVNGLKVYFNPALTSDNNVFFTVPENAPWGSDKPNKIAVVTNYGSTSFDFTVLQPPPSITSIAPLAAGAGEVVTIKGTVFNEASSVRFDNTEAVIVSKSNTEIKVKVPNGIVQAYLYVTTPGGTSKSPMAFGFKKVMYDDALASGFDIWGGWGGSKDFASTTVVKRGTNSIKVDYAGGWGSPIQLGYSGAILSFSNYTAVKISIYGTAGTEGNKVKLVFNGNGGKELVLHEGVWTDYTIPLSELTTDTSLSQVWLQEFSGVGGIIYVDDIGFI